MSARAKENASSSKVSRNFGWRAAALRAVRARLGKGAQHGRPVLVRVPLRNLAERAHSMARARTSNGMGATASDTHAVPCTDTRARARKTNRTRARVGTCTSVHVRLCVRACVHGGVSVRASVVRFHTRVSFDACAMCAAISKPIAPDDSRPFAKPHGRAGE